MSEESIRCSRCGGVVAHCACSLALRQTFTPAAPVDEEAVARVRLALELRARHYAHPDYEQETTEDAFTWAEVRALCSAVETLTRERDEAITKWARAAEEAHDATARADRLQATLDGLAAKVEGMLVDLPSPHGGTVAEDFVRARNRALHAVLTLLDPWRGPDPQPVRLDLDTDE